MCCFERKYSLHLLLQKNDIWTSVTSVTLVTKVSPMTSMTPMTSVTPMTLGVFEKTVFLIIV